MLFMMVTITSVLTCWPETREDWGTSCTRLLSSHMLDISYLNRGVDQAKLQQGGGHPVGHGGGEGGLDHLGGGNTARSQNSHVGGLEISHLSRGGDEAKLQQGGEQILLGTCGGGEMVGLTSLVVVTLPEPKTPAL